MQGLAEQQAVLLQALWAPRHEDATEALACCGALRPSSLWHRGLRAYRSSAHALSARALAGAYPIVAELVGQANFDALARGLWLRWPPLRGDLAHWGAEFPAHIEATVELHRDEPYLADVARVEWALHRAAGAMDGERDTASFALLAECDPADITLLLAPGTQCVASNFPVASIVAAHVHGTPSLEEAGVRLRAGVKETALAWRNGFKPCLRVAQPGEAEFVAALQERRSLADSLTSAQQFDFGAWLAPAVQDGLLLGAVALNPTSRRTP